MEPPVASAVVARTDRAEVLRYIDEVADRAEGKGGRFTGDDAPEGIAMTTVPGSHQPAAAQHLAVARDHAHMGTAVPTTARGRRAKQALVTALRPVTNYQTTFNAELADAVAELLAFVDEIEARASASNAQLFAAVATAETTADSLTDEVAALRRQRDEAEQERRRIEAELVRLRAYVDGEVRMLRSRQESVLRAARDAVGDQPAGEPLVALSRQLDATYDELYSDLEDAFRGTRPQVKELLAEYLPDVAGLGGGPVLDVGCGRGEWLEVLRDVGVPAYGVDTNEAFVAANADGGLDVRAGDAVAHLRDLPEGSLRAVTGFHLAEHLPLDVLVELVDVALRALQPGGLLILETPNPTNLKVGAAAFYLDPTHVKPLHPQLLQFLVESRGFADAEVRYLHTPGDGPAEPADLGGADLSPQLAGDLHWALYGPLDYAVVARKATLDPAAAPEPAEAGPADDGSSGAGPVGADQA